MTKSIKYTLSMEREWTRKTTDYSLNLLARYHASWTPKIEVKKSKIMIKQFSKIKNQKLEFYRSNASIILSSISSFEQSHIFFYHFFKRIRQYLSQGMTQKMNFKNSLQDLQGRKSPYLRQKKKLCCIAVVRKQKIMISVFVV